MKRIRCTPRDNWQQQAQHYGFHFHTMYGEPYWDESAYYRFSLAQIENDIEDPSAQLQQMCLAVVDKVVNDEYWLTKFAIPEAYWDLVRDSWRNKEESLYSRFDLLYNGAGPAKLLENNADTPTSLYETGFWQWLWLEDKLASGDLPARADQFNSLQDKLIARFALLRESYLNFRLHVSCWQDALEDRATVQYLQDCASQAGVSSQFIHMADIGINGSGCFTDLEDREIRWLFKLYPWEFMLREPFAAQIKHSACRMLEPAWKSILSNKALLPMLWREFPHHPNLLPAWFSDEVGQISCSKVVKKPLFSREGANISILEHGKALLSSDGPYGEEGFIYQQYQQMPCFDDNYTLIGSWLVGDEPAGMAIREDHSPITQDLSRFLPHVIID